MEQQIKDLIETYNCKIITYNKELDKVNLNEIYSENYKVSEQIRLISKLNCYQTFLTELQRCLPE